MRSITPGVQPSWEAVYRDINLTPGGVYVGRDGRPLAELTFHFSPEVQKLLANQLCDERTTLNSFDVNMCLEQLSRFIGSENPSNVTSALQGVREIFDVLLVELSRLPDHPRLFRFGEVFQTKDWMSLVLDSVPVDGVQTADGVTLVENLRYSHDWKDSFVSDSLTDEQQQDWVDNIPDDGRHSPSSEACSDDGMRRTARPVESQQETEGECNGKAVWRPPRLSRAQVCLAFDWVNSFAQKNPDTLRITDAMGLLCHLVQQVSSKLATMTGDGYESIPGTRLFSDPESGKAISRVEIEHALLTSNERELLETAMVGAVMVALGGWALTPSQLGVLGIKADGNTYDMPPVQQLKSGLRVLRLIHQLSTADPLLRDVLRLYGQERLGLPDKYPDLAESCARVWELRDVLDVQLWQPRTSGHYELQNHLISIIIKARALLGPYDGAEIRDVPHLGDEQ
jgi:hypothetical protein